MLVNLNKVDKVLFAYGGRIEQSPSGNYYGNELNDTIVNRFLTLGNSVTFIVRKKLIGENQTKTINKFESERLSIVTVPDYTGIKSYYLSSNKCKSIIAECVLGCDILIARLPSSVGYWAIDAAKRFSKPYMIEVVGCPWDALWNHSLLGKVLAPYAYLRLKKYVWKAPFVLYVTNRFLQARYKSPYYQAGISDVIIHTTSESILENRLLKIENTNIKNGLVLGTLAGLDVSYKGQDTVLEVIAYMKSKGFYITYKLAGKGTGKSLVNKAQKLGIKEHLKIIGQLSHNKVFDFLDTLDIYIQPSRQEGMPRALIEAMSRACPCIGSKAGGIPELLSSEYCFSAGNKFELAAILLKLNNQLLTQMASENFLKSKEYSDHILAKKRNLFYSTFLNEVQNKKIFKY